MKKLNLKATWKCTYRSKDGIRRNAYYVTGDADSIAFYEEKQEEVVYADDDDETPLFFTRTCTKTGNIVWNEEKEMFVIEMDFASALMLSAIESQFSNRNDDFAFNNKKDEEDQQDEQSEQNDPKPKKRLGTRKSK